MTRHRKLVLSLASLIVLLMLTSGFMSSCRKPAQTIRIGYLPIYVDLPLFVAKDKGFFEKRGVRVELVRFASSPEIGTALVTNNVEVGASIAYSVVLGSESRDPNKLKVFLVDSETPENYLDSFVVLRDSGIKSLADLKGKKLASFPGPTAVTFCKMVLEKNGINPDTDLSFVELDVASHLSALESRTVDALFTYEPTATQAVLEKNAVKLLPGAVESQIINPWQAGVWVVTNKLGIENPDQASAIIAAIYDAVDYMRANPSEAKASLSNYTSVKPQVAQATPNIPFAKIGEIDLNAFQKHADILTSRGVLSKQLNATSLLVPQSWVPAK